MYNCINHAFFMADIITRLILQSDSYDSKIKRATQGLLQMEQECRKVGGTLAVLEKDQLDYVRSLGNMETVSRNARGQLSELTAAFTELSMQYKRLTDEEKKGDYGKALSSSLSQLKTRIQDTKGQLSEISGEINGGGGLTGTLDQLAGKFGLNIHQLAGWGAAMAAAKVALDVAKDAFFASEATVDEWGRVMDSSKSLYEGFLTSLNTGDISGYLSRMNEIANAARTAYDELDRLGTMKTIQAPQMSAQQTENERMRMMIQTGRYIAPVDGRNPAPGMKDGQLLTPAQIRTLEQQLQNGMNTVVGLIGNEVKQTTAAIDAVYKRQGAELGMSVKEFRQGTSSMAEFEKRLAGAEKYNEYERLHTNMQYSAAVGRYVQKRDNTVNPFGQYKGWDVFRVDGDRYNELVQLILKRDQQASQAYGMQSQTYRTINRAEGVTTRSLLGGKTGGGVSTTNSNKTPRIETAETDAKELTIQQQISALEKEALTASRERRESIREQVLALDAELQKQKEIRDLLHTPVSEAETMNAQGLAYSPMTDADVKSQLDQQLKDAGITMQIKMPQQQQRNEVKLTEIMSGMSSGISSMVSGIEGLGVELPQGLKDVVGGIQSVTQILSAIMSIVSVIQAVSAADAIIPFAGGGIVPKAAGGMLIPGNSFSGDNLRMPISGGGVIGVNSGELILNRVQQDTIAAALEQSDENAIGGTPYVLGETIYIGLTNYLRRTGRGELITANR